MAATVKLRALLGLWDGEQVIFAGAKRADEYDTLDHDVWDDLILEWQERAPCGTEAWREVWMTVEIPTDLFEPDDAPTLPSKAEAPDAS